MAKTKAEDGIAPKSWYVHPEYGPCDETNDFNVGLILTTSIFALPLALAVFPQRQAVNAKTLEAEFWDRGGKDGMVEFNRGI